MVITFGDKIIKVIIIKEYDIEEIQNIFYDYDFYSIFFKFSKDKIGIYSVDEDCEKILNVYFFENRKLMQQNDIKIKLDFDIDIDNICPINENEIVMRYEKNGKFWSKNHYIVFYEIENYKIINSFKFDYCYNESPWNLINKNILSYQGNKKIYLFDLKNHTIQNKFNLQFSTPIIFLNESKIITMNLGNIHEYELQKSNKFKLIGTKKVDNKNSCYELSKYPGNKLLIFRRDIPLDQDGYKKKIVLYG